MLGGYGDAPVFAALLDADDASYFFDDASKHEGLQNERYIINPPHELTTEALSHGEEQTSLSVRVAQIAFHGEVFSETVQVDVLDLRGLAHVAEACASSEGDRA